MTRYACDDCSGELTYLKQTTNVRGQVVSVYRCTDPVCSVDEVERR
ncbi:hypothetical protein [Haladaptatus sp. ZSTT2]